MEGYDVDSSRISLGKDTKVEIEPVGLQVLREGGKVNNGAVHNRGCLLYLDLHTQQVTLFPTKFREVVNLSGLVVYKGSNTRGNKSATEKKRKTVNSSGVNL